MTASAAGSPTCRRCGWPASTTAWRPSTPSRRRSTTASPPRDGSATRPRDRHRPRSGGAGRRFGRRQSGPGHAARAARRRRASAPGGGADLRRVLGRSGLALASAVRRRRVHPVDAGDAVVLGPVRPGSPHGAPTRSRLASARRSRRPAAALCLRRRARSPARRQRAAGRPTGAGRGRLRLSAVARRLPRLLHDEPHCCRRRTRRSRRWRTSCASASPADRVFGQVPVQQPSQSDDVRG